MQQRINGFKASPAAYQAMLALRAAVESGLEKPLIELIKIRASQISKCLPPHMHTRDARSRARPRSASICSCLAQLAYSAGVPRWPDRASDPGGADGHVRRGVERA